MIDVWMEKGLEAERGFMVEMIQVLSSMERRAGHSPVTRLLETLSPRPLNTETLSSRIENWKCLEDRLKTYGLSGCGVKIGKEDC